MVEAVCFSGLSPPACRGLSPGSRVSVGFGSTRRRRRGGTAPREWWGGVIPVGLPRVPVRRPSGLSVPGERRLPGAASPAASACRWPSSSCPSVGSSPAGGRSRPSGRACRTPPPGGGRACAVRPPWCGRPSPSEGRVVSRARVFAWPEVSARPGPSRLPPRGCGPPFVLPPTPLVWSRPRPAPGCLPTPPGGFRRGSRRFPPSRLAAAGAEVARRGPADPAHTSLRSRLPAWIPRACAVSSPGVSPRESRVGPVSRRGTAFDVRVTSGYTMGGCLPGFGPRFLPLVSRARFPAAVGVWPAVCRGRRSCPPSRRSPVLPHPGALSPPSLARSLCHPVPATGARGKEGGRKGCFPGRGGPGEGRRRLGGRSVGVALEEGEPPPALFFLPVRTVLSSSSSSPSLPRRASLSRPASPSPPPPPLLARRVVVNTHRSLARSRSSYLVDPASSICLSQRLSHACLSTHGRYSETANGSLNQLWFLWSLAPLLLG